MVLLPALTPDVALMHAQYVGDDGTVRIKGLTFLNIEQVRSASLVIVTCEEIVPAFFLRQDPDQNPCLPSWSTPWSTLPLAPTLRPAINFYDYDPRYL